MTKKTAKQSKFKHFLLGPIKILKKARQFYMKTVIECAGGYGVGAANHIPHLPKPKITTLNVVDEGINVATATRRKQSVLRFKNNNEVKQLGKIDEDQPCHFESNQIGLKTKLLHLYPTRRSSSIVTKIED
ncbi:hypothetical protein TSUD_47640 [Trifolium subterraneum]|nr:hypothetical protein TSUD_47640 [Trifolium subterraneum]